MLNFRPLEPSDQTKMIACLHNAPWMKDYHSSELVFENVYPWSKSDRIEIAWQETYGIIRCYRLGAVSYFPPIAMTQEAFVEAIRTLISLVPDLFIIGLTEAMVPMMRPFGGVVLYDDILAEYIYQSAELIELKGSKFHRRRNQLNQFLKKYPYRLTDYQNEDAADLIHLLNRYVSQGGDGSDRDALLFAIAHREQMNVACDLLWVEETVVALSISTRPRDDFGIVLFEKADIDYIGSYVAINQLACKKRFATTTYVSRQEDLGLPHLRKAKLANQPAFKERKYAYVHHVEYRQLHELYAEAFSDASDYRDYFFLNQSNPHRTVVEKVDGVVVSGLHLIPRDIVFNRQTWRILLVVGAATLTAFQRRGHFQSVIRKALAEAYRMEVAFVGLAPSDASIYERYGFFSTAFLQPYGSAYDRVAATLEQTVSVDALANMYQTAVAKHEGYQVRDVARWNDWMGSLYQEHYEFDLIKVDGRSVGYVVHRAFDIEEFVMIEPLLPIVEGFDFAAALVPAPQGIPNQMIRIVHLPTLLSQFTVSESLHQSIKVRIVDDAIEANNVTVELFLDHGHIRVEPATSWDVEVTIQELAGILFSGRGFIELQPLKPTTSMVSYDEY